jgi:transcriptional regulator with PAS, ATPase and Fis domain
MNLAAYLLSQIDDPNLTYVERTQLRCQLARELEDAGNYEAARGALGELWQCVGERPRLDGLDQEIAAEVLLRTGTLTGWSGSLKQIEGAQEIAKNLISESITIFESLHKPEKVGEALTELAYCYWREGAFDEARVTLRDALIRLERDDERKAIALIRSAIVEKTAARFNDALHILRKAEPLIERHGSHTIKGNFHNTLANVLKYLGTSEQRADYTDKALIEYAAASFHFEQAGHKRYCARVENNLGFLLFRLGRFSKAHKHLERARRLFAGLKDRGSVAQVDETRAKALLAEGRDAEAEKVARSAVRTLEQGGEQSLLAEALTTYGTALARLKHYQQAHLTLQRAVEVAHQAGDPESAGLAALTLIEELHERLAQDELRNIYQRADTLLAKSQNLATLERLRACAHRIITAEQTLSQEFSAPDFIYVSERMASILRDAHRIAATAVPILITGETGTGKEVLARFIHLWSGRAGDFVIINCGSIPENLIESHLFGHMRGSFTDAVKDHRGAAKQAAGGTLFLDEIGELNINHQAKLLRLVEHGEIHTIGAEEPERVNVRILAATNRNLKDLVAKKRFRDDLFYRLCTFQLEIPPLRDRPEDIPVLAEHFIKEFIHRHRKQVTFTPEAISAMRMLSLKGNVRELRALLERTILIAKSGATITEDAVETISLRQTQMVSLADPWANFSLQEEVRIFEERLIELALKEAKGMITHAARLLGFKNHAVLQSRLKKRNKSLQGARKPASKRRRSIIRS